MTREEALNILSSEQAVAMGIDHDVTSTNIQRKFARLKHDALGVAISALQEPERKHGSWKLNIKESTTSYECSACKIVTDMRYGFYKFCPHCGAEMDGDTEVQNEDRYLQHE
ncbi:hypothetical protein ACPW7J_09555 [Ihubacter sp. rT4E-8]|uniref:hypothetical protein n=1 Tax=Ihubacter sp. rT4E-8 TaxID=3242369 RepID=UPI003CF9BBD7